MDVKAILVATRRQPQQTGIDSDETIAGVPMAFLDVLGLPVLDRVLQPLQQFGISGMTLVTDAPPQAQPFVKRATLRPDIRTVNALGRVWPAAEDAFTEYAESGAELILLLRIGPYVELDYEELIQHHLDKHCRITAVQSRDGVPLDIFVLTASRRKDAAVLLQSGLSKLRNPCAEFRTSGYVNPLRDAGDLRRLALDGLMKRNLIRPVGREMKPGVWVGQRVRVHPKARITAPAYIGDYSNIRASALITRGSVVEHHCEVDCGTVVENSTLLPYSRVGAGLDVTHSVVGFRRLAHLLRGVEVEVADAKLLGMAATSAVSRMAGSAAALFTVLPREIYRALFAPSRSSSATDLTGQAEQPTAVPDAVKSDSFGGSGSEAAFTDSLMAARRYGDE